MVVPARLTTTLTIPAFDFDEDEYATADRPSTYFPPDGKLVLIIGDDVLNLSVGRRIVLGRKSKDSSPLVVDLTHFASYQLGVSRNHAAIEHVDGDHLELSDLASVNGTFLNGKRLIARVGYGLHDGDEIRLSELIIRVRFE